METVPYAKIQLIFPEVAGDCGLTEFQLAPTFLNLLVSSAPVVVSSSSATQVTTAPTATISAPLTTSDVAPTSLPAGSSDGD